MYLRRVREPAAPHDPDRIILPALLAACPSFLTRWRQHVADWSDSDDRGVYVDLGVFAGHLVSLMVEGRTTEFARVFAVVERLFRDSDGGGRCALSVGRLG